MILTNYKGNDIIKPIGFILSVTYFILTYVTYINPQYQILITYNLYTLCALALIYTVLQQKISYNIYLKYFLLFFIVTFIFSVLPHIGSTYYNTVIKSTLDILNILILTYCFSLFINKKDLKNILIVISISSILSFIFTGNNFDIYSGERFGNELAGNANIISSLYMIAAIASTYCIFNNKNILLKLIFCLLFCVQIFAIILTGSKKALVIPILFFALYFILTRKKKAYAASTLVIVIAFCYFLYFALYNIPLIYDLIGYRFEGMISAFTNNQGDASTMERINMIHDALDFWQTKPLCGIGLNLFSEKSIYGTYSHNNYVELLSTTGLIGCISYYVIHFKLLKRIMPYLVIQKQDAAFYFLLIICLLIFDIGAVSYKYSLIQAVLSLCGIYCNNITSK